MGVSIILHTIIFVKLQTLLLGEGYIR